MLTSLAPHYQHFLSVFIANEDSEMNEDGNRMEKPKDKKQPLANNFDWHVPSSS